MHTLTQPYPLIQGTIIQNPLFAPTDSLLGARKVRQGFFRTQTSLSALDSDIAQYQSSPGLWCGYDIFGNIHNSKEVVDIGLGFKESVLRITLEDGSIESIIDFIDAKDIVPKALNRGILVEASYEEALNRVLDIIADNSTDITVEFDRCIVLQVEDTLQKLDDLGLSERPVFQVNIGSNGDLIAFPKKFFQEHSSGDDEPSLMERLKAMLENMGPKPILSPVRVR